MVFVWNEYFNETLGTNTDMENRLTKSIQSFCCAFAAPRFLSLAKYAKLFRDAHDIQYDFFKRIIFSVHNDCA